MTVLGTEILSTQIQLMRHPVGWPAITDFGTVKVELLPLREDEVRVATSLFRSIPTCVVE